MKRKSSTCSFDSFFWLVLDCLEIVLFNVICLLSSVFEVEVDIALCFIILVILQCLVVALMWFCNMIVKLFGDKELKSLLVVMYKWFFIN